MPITNYIPSSRLIQPGVCTSSTRPASPYNGMVIYETDTLKTYVYNGSAWVMQVAAGSPPGLELIKTQTVGSSVTSVSVSGVFSSSYSTYLVTCTGMTSNVSGYGLKMKLNNSTGSTYYMSMFYMVMGSTGTFAAAADNATSEGIFCAFSAPNYATSFNMTVFNPFASLYTTTTFASSGQDYMAQGSGVDKNSVSHTGFTLNSYSGATMTEGVIRVYGYRNTI